MEELEGGKSFRYTSFAISLLDKILGSNIIVNGVENIPDKPVLFVANHFTRCETIVVPYIIHKYTKRQVRSLADKELFHGGIGNFLRKVGTMPTDDKKRDQTIISDLISGKYDWMIYPEGSMIKSKVIKRSNLFTRRVSNDTGFVRTGSAVLALKSELYRQYLVNSNWDKDNYELNDLNKEFPIEFDENLRNIQTHIVPINITYYPIRPGKNVIKTIVGKFFKNIPTKLSEELEIEGNLLLSSNINISFGKPIDVGDYAKDTRDLIYQIPIIKNSTKVNLVLKYLKYNLTSKFMDVIYNDLKINIDHLFIASLFSYPKNTIQTSHLKKIIYLSASEIINLKKHRFNVGLSKNSLHKIISDEPCDIFDDVLKLAKNIGIVTDNNKDGILTINRDKFNGKYDFHDIRLENILQVILNEFLLLPRASFVVKKVVSCPPDKINQKIFNSIHNHDLDIFNGDYEEFCDKDLSKDKGVGRPFFLNSLPESKNSGYGVLLIHGYLAAPKEMRKMAKYFHDAGFKVYGVRLRGHGTAPKNLENVVWQDWYESVNRGHIALRLICSKVFVVGFSTGGLLSLLLSSRKNNIDAMVCINPALRLKDIRTKITFGIHMWNDALEKFKIQKGRLRYVLSNPENPHINYSRNYLSGIEQLEFLMTECEESLSKITCPILAIQSDNDPIVVPKSAQIALKKSNSDIKEFFEVQSNRHVIVNSIDASKVFNSIYSFFKSLPNDAKE